MLDFIRGNKEVLLAAAVLGAAAALFARIKHGRHIRKVLSKPITSFVSPAARSRRVFWQDFIQGLLGLTVLVCLGGALALGFAWALGKLGPPPEEVLAADEVEALERLARAVDRAATLVDLNEAIEAWIKQAGAAERKAYEIPTELLDAARARWKKQHDAARQAVSAAYERFFDRHLATPDSPRVRVETTLGSFEVQLFDKHAPETVRNFLEYVGSGHYDGLIFHRVNKGELIMGGGFDPEFRSPETNPPIRSESSNLIPNIRGTIAMNRGYRPNSATDTFFINVGDNPKFNLRLNPDRTGYAVFGRVIEGMEVVDRIQAVPTTLRPATARTPALENVPIEPVVIRSVRRVK